MVRVRLPPHEEGREQRRRHEEGHGERGVPREQGGEENELQAELEEELRQQRGLARAALGAANADGVAVDLEVAAEGVLEAGHHGAGARSTGDAGDVGVGLEEVPVVAAIVVQLPE